VRSAGDQSRRGECKEAIPPLAIPGCGCAPLGIPGAVTSVTVVTLVPESLHSHYISIRTIYIGPVYSCVISLITPHHHSLQHGYVQLAHAIPKDAQSPMQNAAMVKWKDTQLGASRHEATHETKQPQYTSWDEYTPSYGPTRRVGTMVVEISQGSNDVPSD